MTRIPGAVSGCINVHRLKKKKKKKSILWFWNTTSKKLLQIIHSRKISSGAKQFLTACTCTHCVSAAGQPCINDVKEYPRVRTKIWNVSPIMHRKNLANIKHSANENIGSTRLQHRRKETPVKTSHRLKTSLEQTFQSYLSRMQMCCLYKDRDLNQRRSLSYVDDPHNQESDSDQ